MLRIATLTYSFNALVLKKCWALSPCFHHIENSGIVDLSFGSVRISGRCLLLSYPLHLRGRPPKGRDVKIFEVVVGH